MRIYQVVGVFAALGVPVLQAHVSYHACQRSVGAHNATDPLAYSSDPHDTDNIANMWWSTSELKIINDALSLVESDLNRCSLPIIATQNTKNDYLSTIPNVQLCHKKSFYYEKTVPLTATDFVLHYCGNRTNPILMPTTEKEYADRKCLWLYHNKATSYHHPTPRDVQLYADNVVEKITGQRPNRRSPKLLPLNSEPAAPSAPKEHPTSAPPSPQQETNGAGGMASAGSSSSIPPVTSPTHEDEFAPIATESQLKTESSSSSPSSQRTSPSSEPAPISSDLIL